MWRSNGGHFLSNLPLLEGNMLYLISILVVEYLDCQYRWEFRTSSPNLMRYFDIKFVLLLCTRFALWAIFELYYKSKLNVHQVSKKTIKVQNCLSCRKKLLSLSSCRKFLY